MSTFNAKSELMARQQPSLSDVILAIKAHASCATRLEHFIRGVSSEELDPDVIGDPTRCALGHWLHNTCSRHFGHLPLMDEVIYTHARLHFTARHILLRYYDGEYEEALAYLSEGAFRNNANLLKHQLGELAGYINVQHPGMASSMVLDEIFTYINS